MTTASLFDIAADLDTPVSAFLKLKAVPAALPARERRRAASGWRAIRSSASATASRCGSTPAASRIGSRPAAAARRPGRAARRPARRRSPRRRSPKPDGNGCSAARRARRCRELRPGALLRAPAGARARRSTTARTRTTSRRESLLVFDHLTRRRRAAARGLASPSGRALRREVIRALRGGLPGPAWQAKFGRARGESHRGGSTSQGVHRAQEYIAAGDVYQLVLSVRFAGRMRLDPFEAYRALRLLNPSPYMYYCELGERVVVGSSPEALVKLNGGHGAAAADRRHAAARRGCRARRRARGTSCSPTRRKTPST